MAMYGNFISYSWNLLLVWQTEILWFKFQLITSIRSMVFKQYTECGFFCTPCYPINFIGGHNRLKEIPNFLIRKWKPCFSRICQKVEDWLRLFSQQLFHYSFIVGNLKCLFFSFLVADTQLYKTIVRPSVRPSVRHGHRVEKWENERFRFFLCMFECEGWVGVWIGVGCPCPPVRNDIVTPCHLFFFFFSCLFSFALLESWIFDFLIVFMSCVLTLSSGTNVCPQLPLCMYVCLYVCL